MNMMCRNGKVNEMTDQQVIEFAENHVKNMLAFWKAVSEVTYDISSARKLIETNELAWFDNNSQQNNDENK